jgi:hypothetical protein
MIAYRTDLIEFVLDQLDFIEDKLKEARDNPSSQPAAIIEAAGTVPQIRARLWAEDEPTATQCLFAFPAIIDRDGADWWSRLAVMDRDEFLIEVDRLMTAQSPL